MLDIEFRSFTRKNYIKNREFLTKKGWVSIKK